MSNTFQQALFPNTRCPHCRCEDGVEGGSWNCEAFEAWQECSCNTCGATWNDTYRLVGHSDLEVPEPVEGAWNRVWFGANVIGDADWKTEYARWTPDKVHVDRILALFGTCKEHGLSQARIPLTIQWGPSSDECTKQDYLSFGECVVTGNSYYFVVQSGHGSIQSDMLDLEDLPTVLIGADRDIFLGQVRKDVLIQEIRKCGDLSLSEAA